MQRPQDKLNPVLTEKCSVMESVSHCCGALIHETHIPIGADGRVCQGGIQTKVQKCGACGDVLAILNEARLVPVPQKKPFEIVDEGSADWFLSKLADIRAQQERVKHNAAERIEQLDADYNRLHAKYGEQLKAWARNESLARRRKTVTLLNGSLAFRAVPEHFEIDSLMDAQQTARLVCPEAFTTTTPPAPEPVEKFNEKLLFDRARQQLEETGEILIGLKLVPADEAFSIKPGAKAQTATGTKE